MKKLRVKRYTQKLKSSDCGPTTVRMILHHFGIERSLTELATKLRYGNFGTYISDNGLLFLNEGLSVTLVTANTILFDFDDRKKLTNKKKVLIYLKKLLQGKMKTMQPFKPGIRIMVEFLEKGGNVVVEIPSKQHIIKAIDRGDLVMALIVPNAFSTIGSFHHFVTVYGYDASSVYIADPWPKAKAGKVSWEDFLYGVHASTVGDLDTGSLLVVGKR